MGSEEAARSERARKRRRRAERAVDSVGLEVIVVACGFFDHHSSASRWEEGGVKGGRSSAPLA